MADPSDLTRDLALLGSALDGLAASGPGALDAARAAREALARLERQSKTLRLDFASFLEMAGRINAQGLDLERIESYVTTLLRGRTGAASVLLLRAVDEDGTLATTRGPERSLELASALARRLNELGRPLDLSNDRALVADAARSPEGERLLADAAVVAPLVQRDGQERVLRGVLLLGRKVTGQPYGARDLEFLGLISELVAIALHNAFLHYAATHDALTSIWSRGYFDVELKREVARGERRRARGTAATFSLVLLDLDHFKRINDGFGHRAGDRVLRHVASTLRSTVRVYDTLARWGGEEFVVVLPDVPKQGGLDAAERFRRALREGDVPADEGAAPLPRVTASFGVATYPDDGGEPRELVQKADAALYRSKEGGRDRVTGA